MEDKELQRIYGKIIKRERLKRGWSQDELARKMNRNNGSYISEIENGKENLSCDTMGKFMTLFGIDKEGLALLILELVEEERQEKQKQQQQQEERKRVQKPYVREAFSWTDYRKKDV